MQTYIFNIAEFNQQQILDEILSGMGIKLFNDYDGDPTSQGSSYIGDYNGQYGLVLIFNNDLNQSQITQLNDLIDNYIYNPDYINLKKFKINNSFDNPSTLDYDIFGLHKKRTLIKGELKEVGYFKNFDASGKTYSDLYVSEFRDYVRDEMGMVVYRTQTSNWILVNNTTGHTETHVKYYTEEEAIQEGITRRGNMVDVAKTTLLKELKAVFGFPLNQSYAFDLLTSVKIEMDYFSQGYTQPLRDAVSASTKEYLTVGIKEAVIEQLTF